jgi:hypothetical protein
VLAAPLIAIQVVEARVQTKVVKQIPLESFTGMISARGFLLPNSSVHLSHASEEGSSEWTDSYAVGAGEYTLAVLFELVRHR